MASSELISIIIPVYNSEQFIARSIESVLSQTHENWELILVDDGSSDASYEIMERYAEKNERIIVKKLAENVGVAEARNVGLRLCRGSYLAFLDSDDWWPAHKLESQLAFMKSGDHKLSYTSYEMISTKGDVVGSVQAEPVITFDEMLIINKIPLLTAMLHVDIVNGHEFKNFGHEDYVFWLDIMRNGHDAHGIDEVLAYYSYRPDSRSANKLVAAGRKWEVYRDYLKLSFFQALGLFLKYAFLGIRKHYL